MKILHVVHSVDPRSGGVIEGVRQLIPALAAIGVETEVLTLDAPGVEGTGNFPVPLHALGPSLRGYGFNARVVPWLLAHGDRYDALIVNGLWQYPGLAVWRATRRLGLPYFVYPHGMLDPWFKRRYPLKHLKKWLYWPWAEYRVLRDAAGVLFTAEEERLQARKSFWLYRCQEEVTGYGIAAPAGDSDAQRHSFWERFPALRGRRIILFLGRLHEKKGCDLLLRSWADFLASRAGKVGPFHLVMAGPVAPEYERTLKALAADLGLASTVTWTGMLTGDLKWGSLRVAEAFILPSHQENFGVSVVEALACGVPVLISDQVNIWREIAADEAGLVENDTLPGTRRLLERWAQLSVEERTAMQQQAGRCFSTRFESAATAAKLKALLARAQANNRGPR